MNYVAQSRRPNPVALLGAIGIPAAFGALLITGLAVSVVITKDQNPIGIFVPTTPPPTPIPPPPPKKIEPQKTEQQQSVITAPTNPFDFESPPAAPDNPLPPSPPLPPGPTPGTGNGLGEGSGPVTPPPPPAPKFDPISAKPRGNVGGWITTRDYRSSWIRREMTGTAGFNLQISAAGRITGCTITSSTGHSQLDQATCSLLQKRARFTPARDDKGAQVAGTFSSSVTWRLPN